MIEWFKILSDARKLAVFRMVGGLFFTSLLTFGYSIHKTSKHEGNIEQMSRMIDTLGQKVNDLRIELVKCQNEYNLVRSGLDDLPIPAYIIDAKDFKAVYLNPAYEDFYLKPMGLTKFDILGTDGRLAFGIENVADYHDNNRRVLRANAPISMLEEIDSLSGRKALNTKFPIYQFGQLTHIGGISYEVFD